MLFVAFKTVAQQLLNGNDVGLTVVLDVTITFEPSVFLIPISLPLNLFYSSFDVTIESPLNEQEIPEEDSEEDSEEECSPSVTELIRSLSINDNEQATTLSSVFRISEFLLPDCLYAGKVAFQMNIDLF